MLSAIRITLVSLLLLLPMQAQAGLPGAALNEQGYSEQAQNAADAAYNALAGLATKGESVRGPSGPLGEIVLNSGSIICNSWIIMIRQKVKELSIATASMGGDSPEYARTADAIQKLNRLAEIIERECTEKGLIGSSGGVSASSGGTTSSGGGDTTGGGQSSGSSGGDDGRIHPRDGETIADEICRRKCTDAEVAMIRAERENERAQAEARKTAGRATEAETARDNAERELTAKRAELQRLRANKPAPMTGGATNAQINEWTQYNRRLDALNRDIPGLESRLPGLRERATSARRVADSDAAYAARTQAAYDAAREAYYDCLRRCKSAAAAAGERTTLVVPDARTTPVNKSVTTPGKVKTLPNKRAVIELENAVSVGGTNAFNPKEVEQIGRGGGKTDKVPVIAPPVVVQPTVTPVKPATPVKTPPVKPAVTVTTPVPVVAKPEPVKETPFEVSSGGSVQFTHMVGSSSCPQDAGTITITTSQAASIAGVECTGTIASRLSTVPSGSGNQHMVKVLFNCSSAEKGGYSGNVTVNVRSTQTGETRTISIPASGTVK